MAEAALSRRLTKAVPNLSQLAQEAGISRQRLTILADEYNEKLEKEGGSGDQTTNPLSPTDADDLNKEKSTASTTIAPGGV